MRDPPRLRLRWPRDRTIALVLAGLLAGEMLSAGSEPSPAVSVVCAVVLAAPLLVLRSHPPSATLCEAVLLVLISHLSFARPVPEFDSGLIVCALSYCCGAHASLRVGVIAVLALTVAVQVSVGFSDFPNVEIAFSTLVPLWVGHQVRLRGDLVDRLAVRARELAEEEDAFAELSGRGERARIARELHDIVAHHLAVIVVQAGAGRMAAGGFDERARERLATIGVAGRQALDDMGRLVDLLNDSEQRDAGARWRDLIAAARAGGLNVAAGELPPRLRLPAAVEQIDYRVVREGLTNAIKYAPGAQVHVEMIVEPGRVEIDIHDTGAARPSTLANTGGGLGLAGIRDRVHAAGGTLEAAPASPRGWRVHATLPAAANDQPPGVALPRIYPSRVT